MSRLPTRFAAVIVAFAVAFRQRRTWRRARALLVGAILAPGVRTVASVLRILGRAQTRRFGTYHRVLSRAAWSSRHASRLLLGLLVRAFVPAGPIVIGLDDTLERRRGRRIAALGIYRDPVRSSRAQVVKASGLRWLSVMLLAPIPWAGRVWALPFLTTLAPSERYEHAQGRRHKRLTERARQLLRQTQRWLTVIAPGRPLIVVADMSFTALELLAALAPTMTCILRLQLNAALAAPAPPRAPHSRGRSPKVGARRPTLKHVLADSATHWERTTVVGWYGGATRALDLATGTAVWTRKGLPVVPLRWVLVRDPAGHFAPQALLSTDPRLTPDAMVQYFVRRWQVEVTFAEARRHLGLETQRQWSERAIARTTPILLALFSVVTLLAHQLVRGGTLPTRQAAWYRKPAPTFSDALAAVRCHIWRRHVGHRQRFRPPARERDRPIIPHALLARLTEALCYVA